MPRKITIIFADGSEHIYRDAPDSTTLAQTQARVGRDFPNKQVAHINGGRAAIPANARAPQQQTQTQPGRARSFGEGLLQGFENVVAYPGDLLTKGLAALGDNRAQNNIQGQRTGARAQEQRTAQYRQAHPNYFTAGDIVGGTIATLPVGAGLGGVVRTATTGTRLARGGEAVAKGLSSGGFKTGLVPTRAAVKAGTAVAPKLTTRLADIAVRGGTGAVTGAATSALSGQDAELGAAMGALLPTAGSMVFRTALDKVVLPAYERLLGEVGAQRAAAIFRSALNMTVQEAKNLAASLPKGMTFGEGLVRAGKVRTEVDNLSEYTVQALQKDAAEGAGKDIYDPMAQAQTAREQSVLNAARGGDTAAKADANLMQRREQAGAAYDPAYEAVRQRANVGAEIIPPLRAQGQAAAQTADEQSALARRMTFGAERADTRVGQVDDLGDQFNPKAVNAARGTAGAMTQRGENAAQDAIRLRGEAAAVQKQLADLRAQGIEVLESGPIAAQIRRKAMAEGITPTQREALLATADDIAALGPIARAGDLDAIYREGGLKAQKLIQSINPTGMAKQTSRLLQDIQPDIAAAIENAGGTGYSAAKTAYATEMQDIGRQKFAGELSDIYGTNESLFADVMGGETGAGKDIVMRAFPGGGKLNFDVNAMLGPKGGAAGPSRLPGLQDIAGNIRVRNEMALQAGTGSNRAGSLMKDPPVEKDIFALGNLVKTPVSLTTAVTNPLAGLGMYILDFINSGRVNAATAKALAEGLQSGKSAEELLSLIPRADRAQILRRAVPDVQNRAKSSFGINTFNALNTPPGGSVVVGYGTGPSGESYPMYGDPSENQNAMGR